MAESLLGADKLQVTVTRLIVNNTEDSSAKIMSGIVPSQLRRQNAGVLPIFKAISLDFVCHENSVEARPSRGLWHLLFVGIC